MVIAHHQIAAAFHQRQRRVVHVQGPQARVDRAQMGFDPLQPAREVGQRQRMRHGELDGRLRRRRMAAQQRTGFVELREHRERLLVEYLAGRREPRRIDRAIDQFRAEPRFERLNPPGERRLRDVSQFSRAAETTRFRERNEVFEPFQFHAGPAADGREEVSILVGVESRAVASVRANAR